MPTHRINVKGRDPARGTEDESYVFSNFANLSLANDRIPGRSYGPGEYYSSSEPKYDSRAPGRTYTRDPPKSYHGPHFEKAPAQEEAWNTRGSTDVWDARSPMRSVATRPETYGRAHSIHESRRKPQVSDAFEKRPQPYTPRVQADYDAYKATENRVEITEKVNSAKRTNVGIKHELRESDRVTLEHGMGLARTGRRLANISSQSRTGFEQKHPYAYEGWLTEAEKG